MLSLSFVHQPPLMTALGAPSMAMPIFPPPTFTVLESELALRERVFSEQKTHFKEGLNQRINLDQELNRAVQEFLINSTQLFQRCVQMDEQTCAAHNSWADEVSRTLNIYEKREEQTKYNVSFGFIGGFNEMLSKMHPRDEIAQLSDVGADQSIAEAKENLISFDRGLKYMQRENYDAQGAVDSCDSPLAIKEEEFKKAQMNAAVWTKLKTLPCETVKQFETVYNLLKLLQSVYKSFESAGMSIYRLKYMTEAIRFMALLISGELEVVRDSTETDTAVHELVTIFFNMVNMWENNSLKTKGVIASLQDHVKQMESNCKLHTRHLSITSFIFMLSSLKMFQKPRSQDSSDQLLRGYKVLRIRLKRVDCFSDVGYELIEFWEHIMESKAVNLEGAYFVLDHQDDKKGKKNADRKIAGVLVYFIAETDEDALLLQKLHINWLRSRKEREMVFEQVSPKLAELQRDDLSDAEDSERRLRRQGLLRKKNSLVVDPRTAAEKKAFQKDEELQEYLCTSDAWRGPVGKFDNQWLEKVVGGSWSMAEEKKRDPTKPDATIWFEKILELQKQTMHMFWALKKNTSSDSSNQAAKRTSKGKNKKKPHRQGTSKRNFIPSSSPKRAYPSMASGC
jgi:hypothetical protein